VPALRGPLVALGFCFRTGAGRPWIGCLSTYRLGSGDVVSIRVLGEDDLKREKIRLSDAGTISFPIIGEIRVLGKRVVELESLIADGLRGKYLLNPWSR
jgi:protein involved in polysaccharide export with SLBB domain